MEIRHCFLILATLLMLSCDNKTVYDQFDRDFEDSRWVKTDVRQYNFELSETNRNYDLVVDFSHIAGFQFGLIPITVELTSPDGKKITEHMLLKIKDEEGNDRGDCTGDYCDIDEVAFKNIKLQHGKYKVTIANEFDNDYLPNVLGLGLRVRYSDGLNN